MLNAIHHIAIIGSNYERSMDFYVNKLGFTVLRENARPERGDVKIDLRLNDETEIELFIVPPCACPRHPPRSHGPEALGLLCGRCGKSRRISPLPRRRMRTHPRRRVHQQQMHLFL